MKILLITPNFFDYPTLIKQELEFMGHIVDWFDDRPSTNNFIKAIIRINRKLITNMIERYFRKIIEKTRTIKYQKVIVISGQSFSFTKQMFLNLKETQIQAEFILYQWDSQKNFPYIEQFQEDFDRCYSFDKTDVTPKNKVKFLPLFYAKKYENIGKMNVESFKYDFLFVGTAHPKKYRYIKEMSEKLGKKYKCQYIYFFFPSRLVYFYRKWKDKELKGANYKEFHYRAINGKQIDELLMQSRCILDSSQAGQLGLTIRVIETLGAKRKLITTNADIVNYDFYREENIYVYDGNEFNLSSSFFTKQYKEIDQDIYKKYSLRNWLNELIEGES